MRQGGVKEIIIGTTKCRLNSRSPVVGIGARQVRLSRTRGALIVHPRDDEVVRHVHHGPFGVVVFLGQGARGDRGRAGPGGGRVSADSAIPMRVVVWWAVTLATPATTLLGDRMFNRGQSGVHVRDVKLATQNSG